MKEGEATKAQKKEVTFSKEGYRNSRCFGVNRNCKCLKQKKKKIIIRSFISEVRLKPGECALQMQTFITLRLGFLASFCK